MVPSAIDPIELYYDNSSVVALEKDPRSHHKAKHIDRKDHLIRDHVEKGFSKICKVHTDLNVPDPMTKPLPRAKHELHRYDIGVRENLCN